MVLIHKDGKAKKKWIARKEEVRNSHNEIKEGEKSQNMDERFRFTMSGLRISNGATLKI